MAPPPAASPLDSSTAMTFDFVLFPLDDADVAGVALKDARNWISEITRKKVNVRRK